MSSQPLFSTIEPDEPDVPQGNIQAARSPKPRSDPVVLTPTNRAASNTSNAQAMASTEGDAEAGKCIGRDTCLGALTCYPYD